MKKLNPGISQGFQKGAIAISLGALFLTACGPQPDATTEEPVNSPDVAVETPSEPSEQTGELNVQVGELTGNIEDYIGETVSVRGEAGEAIGETAFVLQDDQLFGGNEVLVFNASNTPFTLPEGEQTEDLQITGDVQQFTVADIEQEYGVTLDPNLFSDYEGQPAIIADSIALAPDPEEISEDPEAYYDQVIAVDGAIGEQLSPNTFTISENGLFEGNDVLVVGLTPNTALSENENVVITGTLRPYVQAEFEQDYDLNWDLDLQRQIEAEYTERPVLVAEEVYPSAE